MNIKPVNLKRSARQRRFFLRMKRIAKRHMPAVLLAYRRRKQAAAIAAKRPLPSRRDRHLARVAEGDARRAEIREQMAANKPQFED